MSEKRACILCGQTSDFDELGALNQQIRYICPNCGQFFVSDEFNNRDIDIHSGIKKHLLSGYIREMNELGNSSVFIKNNNVIDMLNSSLIPKDVNEKINKLLLYLSRKTTYLREPVKINLSVEPAICYAVNTTELVEIINVLQQSGYLYSFDDLSASTLALTLKGIQYASNIEKLMINSKSVFVAMWFSDEMTHIYENAIKPAIEAEEVGGFKAFRVDTHEHNNDITDEIIAGIKACKFVVADMTGHRGGVYYEAGYAKGLGKPVIYTCRKDWFDGEKDTDGKTVKEKIHFDINHQNIIVWEAEDYLKKRIVDRIRATIL